MMDTRLSDYNRTAILSATPAQLLVMLYDRLLLDLHRAHRAQTASEWESASGELLHAQAIIAELQSSLDVEAWEGGPGLMALYVYLGQALVNANIHRDQAITAECIALLEPLRVAWFDASRARTHAATVDGVA